MQLLEGYEEYTMDSASDFTLRDPEVKHCLLIFVEMCFIAVLGAVLSPNAVLFWAALLLCFALALGAIECQRLYKKYVRDCWRIQDLEAEIEKANGPRMMRFVIDDPKLKLSTLDTKYVLVGWLKLNGSGLLSAADGDQLKLEMQASSPTHKEMVMAPHYEKCGIDPRTGEKVLKILGAYYTLPKSYKP